MSRDLTRRDLMKAGLAGGAMAATTAAGPLLPWSQASPAAAAEPIAAPAPFELEEATIADLQEGMQSGRWTARSLVEAYLARIEELNRKGPELRAVIETNPDALAIADAPRRRAQGEGTARPAARHPDPPQGQHRHGRPDDDHGRLAGARRDRSRSRDAFLAARLREAGAVILGKTNLCEWANFRSTRSTSGWSGRGGQCRNPYALDRNSVRLQLGLRRRPSPPTSRRPPSAPRRTARSSRRPRTAASSASSPRVGLVSRAGIIPIAHSQDTAGPDGPHGRRRRRSCSAP